MKQEDSFLNYVYKTKQEIIAILSDQERKYFKQLTSTQYWGFQY